MSLRAPGFRYDDAGERAQPEVRAAIARFRGLVLVERAARPLLYWLLGGGTPPYKIAKLDAAYQGSPVGGRKCGNCGAAWRHVTTPLFICDQVSGPIAPEAWCNRWRPPVAPAAFRRYQLDELSRDAGTWSTDRGSSG